MKKILTILTICTYGTLFGTTALAQNAKPNVVIMATGGTIAGAGKSNTDTANYKAGTIGVQALLEAVPELADVANITSEQFSNIGSSDFTTSLLLKLAQNINEKLSSPAISGIVVTHGTDTLEETAFFLDLTTGASRKPVVMVAAMRPATALSADGPLNLLQATALAANPSAKNRGTLIVMSDRIGSAFYTTKTNPISLDAFRATEQGSLGVFVGKEPNFYYSAATPTGKMEFDVAGVQSLPKVSIIYMHDDQNNDQLEDAIRAGAKGIVIVGNGNGSMPSKVKARVYELTKQGFPVIRASRTGGGFVTQKVEGMGAGSLNAQKARLLLMLCLAKGLDEAQIRASFGG